MPRGSGSSAAPDRVAVRAVVEGRVQGVGFRAATLDTALSLGVVGYVANRWDGTVEVLAEGTAGAVQALLAWLQRGPSFARVERVSAQWLSPSDRYERFEVH